MSGINDDEVSRHSLRIEPMSRSAYGFWPRAAGRREDFLDLQRSDTLPNVAARTSRLPWSGPSRWSTAPPDDGEEVNRNHLTEVIVQKRLPGLAEGPDGAGSPSTAEPRPAKLLALPADDRVGSDVNQGSAPASPQQGHP
jgi:hypothetical protein